MGKTIKEFTPFTKEDLKENFEGIPDNIESIKRVRVHQGWWRLNILNQKAGQHPIRKNDTVCNTIRDGEISGANFLTENTLKVVKNTLQNRLSDDGGKIEEGRLYNNLLSSQPLCFNFFAELELNKELGVKILQNWWSDITKLNEVLFEYSPPINYTKDGSAFDIAFDVQFGSKRGFIGLECKYTDTFSYKPQKSKVYYGDKENKNYSTYLEIFNSNKKAFKADYFDFVLNKDYNQLFRNQLMAESILNNSDNKFEVVKTGLFCYEQDEKAIQSGLKFQSMLSKVEKTFSIITYKDFIESTQKLDLSWEERGWVMLLWARYCGMKLSENIYNQLLK